VRLVEGTQRQPQGGEDGAKEEDAGGVVEEARAGNRAQEGREAIDAIAGGGAEVVRREERMGG
jgi:hypothetical protein